MTHIFKMRAEKQRDLLVDEPGRRQIAEQFDQHVRRDADLLDAFAPRGRERRFIRLDVPGDDLDEIAFFVEGVGREANWRMRTTSPRLRSIGSTATAGPARNRSRVSASSFARRARNRS
jgi:hypothetical protein